MSTTGVEEAIVTTDEAEEVEDYMSDTFVPKEINDVRPSLLYSHTSRLKHAALKTKSSSDPKPKTYYRQLEERLREEALNTPLDSSNKGYKMLAKMGFNLPPDPSPTPQPSQPSATTSESTATATTAPVVKLTEPIRIELKNDRKGLGAAAKKRKTGGNDGTDTRRPIDDPLVEEQFRTHKRSRNVLFLMSKDLRTAQKVCRNLDVESGVDVSDFLAQTERPKWFWPPIDRQTAADDGDGVATEELKPTEEVVEADDDDNEEEGCVEHRFKTINEYLRRKYFYCIWCGIQFTDSEDMDGNCSGDTRDDHQ
ncbi:unnamed protein product [Medioppia subpectinata]|uniref:DUF4187 domain-containing protein n=1 Tax=Medioppia subpectinata TaxID=1979941 RepID=A0A7R9LC83_9ACAR|nr:unnamed protein product [Medioppia subpectinata]CAG2117105.1 unnamed protein product [Medioppia subpectinata]